MSTVKLSTNGTIGGVIQGAFGTYTANSDGTYTVDSRDVPTLLTVGMSYVEVLSASYFTAIAPAAATSGQIVASTALTNGTIAVSNQPDVLRQAQLVIGTGTSAPSAGSVAIVYKGNDSQSGTDTFTTLPVASGTVTLPLSRGVAHVTSITVAGVTGGTSPWMRIDTTATLAVPVPPSAVDIVYVKETVETGDITVGTVSLVSLGCIAPTDAPNGTHTYSWIYGSVGATS